MKKLTKQILILLAFVLVIVFTDLFFYKTFTTRYITDPSADLHGKNIEADKYLPFDDNSEAVVIDTDFTLTGDLPVLDGASALYPVYSAFVGSVYPEDSVVFDGENFAPESALQLNNTVGAYNAVVTGESDIVFCAYPSQAQLDYATENGVELVLVPIGREAFVFIVNSNNPVDNLTSDQIRSIYSGDIRSWSEVGGSDDLISPLRRVPGSGSQSAMDRFMNGIPIQPDYDAAFGKAIAFSFRYYVSDLTSYADIKFLSVDGVYPSVENIRNGTYPQTSYFYAVYRADNDNPNVELMLDWILSDEGQSVIESNGYVGIA